MWIQARNDKPKFYEGIQQIQRYDLSLDFIVANFKDWLKKSGITVEENRWDSYFFQETTPDPTARDWKRYILVYFHATGAVVIEPSRFIVDYTLAARNGDAAKLTQLFNAAVSCPACEKVVDPAIRANKKGFLECPFCGQWWTKPVK